MTGLPCRQLLDRWWLLCLQLSERTSAFSSGVRVGRVEAYHNSIIEYASNNRGSCACRFG
jgi:hypothetical protein